mmetsp:Transcript_57287/g.153395  ORF Transcript_57287/g.153395 Transcript_57287/m.153395 type:complete len:268 (+) Transcript_57287:629-1432(+)
MPGREARGGQRRGAMQWWQRDVPCEGRTRVLAKRLHKAMMHWHNPLRRSRRPAWDVWGAQPIARAPPLTWMLAVVLKMLQSLHLLQMSFVTKGPPVQHTSMQASAWRSNCLSSLTRANRPVQLTCSMATSPVTLVIVSGPTAPLGQAKQRPAPSPRRKPSPEIKVPIARARARALVWAVPLEAVAPLMQRRSVRADRRPVLLPLTYRFRMNPTKQPESKAHQLCSQWRRHLWHRLRTSLMILARCQEIYRKSRQLVKMAAKTVRHTA